MATPFTALKNFSFEGSDYCAGLSYTARSIEDYDTSNWKEDRIATVKGRCDALAAALPQWVAEGKVSYGAASTGVSGISGE